MLAHSSALIDSISLAGSLVRREKRRIHLTGARSMGEQNNPASTQSHSKLSLSKCLCALKVRNLFDQLSRSSRFDWKVVISIVGPLFSPAQHCSSFIHQFLRLLIQKNWPHRIDSGPTGRYSARRGENDDNFSASNATWSTRVEIEWKSNWIKNVMKSYIPSRRVHSNGQNISHRNVIRLLLLLFRFFPFAVVHLWMRMSFMYHFLWHLKSD